MPIKMPSDLPARRILEAEGIVVVRDDAPARQAIRPLRIAILNLMPEKVKTETQLARMIGSTPLQVDLTLLTTASYTPKNVSKEHLQAFYTTWQAVSHQTFDGMIITGAPVEELPFEAVEYWHELIDIFEWAQENVYHTYNICWGAQAALFHFHGIPKHALEKKMFGVFRHKVVKRHAAILRGFTDEFVVPVSRHTEVRRDDMPNTPGLDVLAESEESGLCMIEDRVHRQVHMFNHLEYDFDTLGNEYARDRGQRDDVDLPTDYFPGDDPKRQPENRWRSHGHLLYGNWINIVYQGTLQNAATVGQGPGGEVGDC